MDSRLPRIAEQLGQEEALALFLDAVAKDEAGEDLGGAIELYKRAFRLWPALDSGGDGDLPRAVRLEAEAAGIDCGGAPREVPVGTQASSRFDVSSAERWLAHLEEHGYCVVAGVADAEAVARAKALLWDYLEGVPNARVKRNDPSSWGIKGDWLPSAGNGLLGGSGFGQSAFCWHTRLLRGVRQAFAAVWDCDDLLVSFDGGNVFRPWARRSEWRTEGGWWHLDQNAFLPGREGRVCVQGLVTFTDATPATGGLCVIPGSHRHHREVCERARGDNLPGDYVPVQADDPALGSGGRLVCAKAGDLLLWDSRCVHCNTPGLAEHAADSAEGIPDVPAASLAAAGAEAELLRVAGYVCMTPAARALDDVPARRKDAFINNMGTNHLPHEHHRERGAASWLPPKRWSEASDAQRRLIVGASSPLLAEETPEETPQPWRSKLGGGTDGACSRHAALHVEMPAPDCRCPAQLSL